MAMPFITNVEEFERLVCAWCVNTACRDRNRWEIVEHSKQIICFDFESEGADVPGKRLSS